MYVLDFHDAEGFKGIRFLLTVAQSFATIVYCIKPLFSMIILWLLIVMGRLVPGELIGYNSTYRKLNSFHRFHNEVELERSSHLEWRNDYEFQAQVGPHGRWFSIRINL